MTNASFFTINITVRYMKTVVVKSRYSYQIKCREILTWTRQGQESLLMNKKGLSWTIFATVTWGQSLSFSKDGYLRLFPLNGRYLRSNYTSMDGYLRSFSLSMDSYLRSFSLSLWTVTWGHSLSPWTLDSYLRSFPLSLWTVTWGQSLSLWTVTWGHSLSLSLDVTWCHSLSLWMVTWDHSLSPWTWQKSHDPSSVCRDHSYKYN